MRSPQLSHKDDGTPVRCPGTFPRAAVTMPPWGSPSGLGHGTGRPRTHGARRPRRPAGVPSARAAACRARARACPPHRAQRRDRRGDRAGSAAARLDPCAALAAAAQFRTWLTRITVNLPQRAAPAAGPAARDDARAGRSGARCRRRPGAPRARGAVAAAIDALPARQRAAIVLTFHEGLGNAETAAVLDTSVSGVEALLVRAKRSLRAALGDAAL